MDPQILHVDENPQITGFIQELIRDALDAVDPRRLVRDSLQITSGQMRIGRDILPILPGNRLRVVAIGKAAASMAAGAWDALGDHIRDGIVLTKSLAAFPAGDLPANFQVHLGNHPVPGSNSLACGLALESFLEGGRQGDILLVLISGGGSALVSLPVQGVSLEYLQDLNRLLLKSGADIREVNTVRKQLDRIKGGGLVKLAFPARVAGLILSDVIGDPLDLIASGMTVQDSSTTADALGILGKYHLSDLLPASLRNALKNNNKEQPDQHLFDSVNNQVLANNQTAVQAVLASARQAGWYVEALEHPILGEARLAGLELARDLHDMAQNPRIHRPFCLAGGGETTVTVRGGGLGGRNLELALAAVDELDGLENTALVTLATDGEDGITGYAGAVVTEKTRQNATRMGLSVGDFLAENNSCRFFEAAGGLIQTGPTGTNVNDLVFLLTW